MREIPEAAMPAAFDAVLVPGGGVRSGGTIPEWVERRFDRAIEIAGDAPIVCLSAGTVYRVPPVDENGLPIYEAVAGANYVLNRGVPAQRILIETSSWDTIGNAFFSLVIHVLPRKFRNLAVITSEFHMTRTRAVFEWIYGFDDLLQVHRLHFEATPDDGMDPEALEARVAKERHSLEAFREVARNIRDLQGLHQWLFTEHDAYAAGRTPAGDPAFGRELLDSY